MERLENNQYLIEYDGLGRVVLRNSGHLRKKAMYQELWVDGHSPGGVERDPTPHTRSNALLFFH